MMYFYTTAEQENELDLEYKRLLAVKQAEIDETERRTGKIQKFTAYGHVHKPDRVFHVLEGHVFYGDKNIPTGTHGQTWCLPMCKALVRGGSKHQFCPPLPTGPVEGGDVYTFDTHFSKQIAEFCKKHSAYKVIFKPHGRYGPCLGYIGSPGSMPAQLIAVTGEVLDADNEDAYDLLCC